MAKRYVPPGARPKGSNSNHPEDTQRSLDDLVTKDEGSEVFTVKLRSDTTYSMENRGLSVS